MVSVAQSKVKIGLRKMVANIIIIAPIMTLLYNAVLATLFAVSLSSRPNKYDISASVSLPL